MKLTYRSHCHTVMTTIRRRVWEHFGIQGMASKASSVSESVELSSLTKASETFHVCAAACFLVL
jgi:hypothetical protein